MNTWYPASYPASKPFSPFWSIIHLRSAAGPAPARCAPKLQWHSRLPLCWAPLANRSQKPWPAVAPRPGRAVNGPQKKKNERRSPAGSQLWRARTHYLCTYSRDNLLVNLWSICCHTAQTVCGRVPDFVARIGQALDHLRGKIVRVLDRVLRAQRKAGKREGKKERNLT